MIKTLHERLALIEQIVEAENQITAGDFEEDLLREDLALMNAEQLINLSNSY